MSVILTNAEPLLAEVNKDLGKKATQIYLFLWDLAVRDVEYDKRKHLPWEQRRDCGGTSEWTIKGLAGHLGACPKSVRKAICLLLDEGFIQAQGYAKSSTGTKHTVWRVTHPDLLEAYRNALLYMPSPSERWQEQMKAKGYVYQGEIWDTTNEPMSFDDGFDPNYYGLYGKDHAEKVTQRVAYYNMTTPRFSQKIVIDTI